LNKTATKAKSEQQTKAKSSKKAAPAADDDIIFSLSKKDLNAAVARLDLKDLARSIMGRAESEIDKLMKNLPVAKRRELEDLLKSTAKPGKAAIEKYRKKVNDLIKSLF
jgi:Mg/Co/Ni transporter MgtE